METELEPKINNFGSATLKKCPAVIGGHMVSPYRSYLRNDLTQHPVAILGVEEHDRLPVGSCKGKHSPISKLLLQAAEASITGISQNVTIRGKHDNNA